MEMPRVRLGKSAKRRDDACCCLAGIAVSRMFDLAGVRLRRASWQDRTVPARLSGDLRPTRALPEYARLFHAISSLNEHNKPFQLQLVASVHGEGTSTVAAAFAAVAAREIASRVLLLDCNPDPDAEALLQPPIPFLLDEFRVSGSIKAALQQPEAGSGLRLARLSGRPDGILGASPAELQRLFDTLRDSFATVVLDCPPASVNPISLALSRYCDGTVLVVRAETTRRSVIAETKRAIERFGGQIVGVVFNQQRTYLPRWLSRRL